MTENNEYDFKPSDKPAPPPRPKPGDPDFVPPIPIIEPPDPPDPPAPSTRFQRAPEPEPEPVDPDVTNNKAMAILAYVFFLIPLIAAPQSKFARFHANQGLMVFILWCIAIVLVIIINVFQLFVGPILAKIAILGAFFSCIFYLIQPIILLGALVFAIMGIINAANGEKKQLPLIGHWNVIK